MSKGKLAGIIVACTAAIIVVVILVIPPLLRTPMHTLSVSINPSGVGSVSPSSGEYQRGVQVTLTATPASGYTFDHWMGGASGTASTITITMNSDKSLTANFRATTQMYTLTTSVSPSGAGSVAPSGGEYESGTQVTLTASPATGHTFDYWSGAASGTTSTITITMNLNKSLTANFKTMSPPAQESMTAEQLLAEYTENEIAANQKYYGKVVEVSGKINNFSIDWDGNPLVHLYAGFLTDVVCAFDSSWESELAQLQKGQTIVVQGTCEGIGFINIDLSDCKLV